MEIFNVKYDNTTGTYSAVNSTTGETCTDTTLRQVMLKLADDHGQVVYRRNKHWRRAKLEKLVKSTKKSNVTLPVTNMVPETVSDPALAAAELVDNA